MAGTYLPVKLPEITNSVSLLSPERLMEFIPYPILRIDLTDLTAKEISSISDNNYRKVKVGCEGFRIQDSAQ